MKQSITASGAKIYLLSDKECAELYRLADEAKANTYPSGANGYAVALMTATGTIYQGVSYKSDTYTLTMHCEATALAHAAIHGEKDVVAITGPNCHMCKQLLYENGLRSGIDIMIVMRNGDDYEQVPLSTMMPYAWPEARTATLGR